MSRDLDEDNQAALQARVVRPVVLVRLDVADDPVTAWTGPGLLMPSGSSDPALDGQTFLPVGPMVSMSAVSENQNVGGAVALSAAAHDLDEALLRQVVRDKRTWRGRNAYIWIGLLDEDQATVIADPFRVKTGVMSQMSVSRDSVDVTIDRDLSNARAAPFRWIDHVRYWADDTASTFILKLSNKPRGLTRSDITTVHPPAHSLPPPGSGYGGYHDLMPWERMR